MRICLISKAVDLKTGGLGRHVSELAESLAENDHEVTVLTRDPVDLEEVEVVELNYIDLHQDVLNSYSAIPSIVNYLRKHSGEFDIVHGHGVIGFSHSLAKILNMSDAKFIYTLHGVSSEHTSRSWLKPFAQALFYPEKLTVSSADGLIAVSEDTKQKAIDYYNLEEERLEVINNGVDMEKFSAEWSFENKILFVGHLVSRKGPGKLLEAFKILADGNPDLELVFVGSGRMKEELMKNVEDSGLSDQVKFRQDVSEEELVGLYSSSIFCMPSKYEGFGMVYIEAMAAGAPVLATEGTAIEEVITDGEDGLMVSREPNKLAESLGKVISDEEFRDSLSKNAKKKAKQFDWSAVAEKTENYYKEVVEEG